MHCNVVCDKENLFETVFFRFSSYKEYLRFTKALDGGDTTSKYDAVKFPFATNSCTTAFCSEGG